MGRRNTLSSMSTEASLEPQSENSESGMTPEAHLDVGPSETPTVDDCQSKSTPLVSTVQAVETPTVDDCQCKSALVASIAQAVASPPCTSNDGAPKAVPFCAGALFVVVAIGLFWGIGAIQIQITVSTVEHCPDSSAQNTLHNLKEEIEKRLAPQERILKDLIAEVHAMQRGKGIDQTGLEAASKMDIVQQASAQKLFVSSSNSTGFVLGSNIPLFTTAASTSGVNKDDLLHGVDEHDLALADPHDVSHRGWFHIKSLCSVWLSLVVICSIAQAPFLSSATNSKVLHHFLELVTHNLK